MISGEVDPVGIKTALDKTVMRNASLRSTFSRDGQEMIVHPEPKYHFEFIDLSKNRSEIDESQLSVIHNQARTPFDLVKGPLLRVVMQKIGDEQFKLTINAHHIVLDGWSLAVFCRDLGYFYDVEMGVEREALPPANSYAEYSKKMDEYFDSADGRADERFWVEQFKDEIPVLDLPIERKRPSLRTYYGRRYDHLLSNELVEKVRKIGAKSGCSLFNVMLAAFNAYVSRISGCNDFCVGIPTAGQAAMDQLELIGHCVNTMPLRTKIDPQQSFVEYMKTSRSQLLDAFDHQRYSYGTLLRKLSPPRDPSRPPMLSVSFNVDPMIDRSELGFAGLEIDVLVEPRSFENFEWFINGVIQNDKSIELQVQYNVDLYSTRSMKCYFEGFECFLDGIANAPDSRINELPTLSNSQRQKVIVDWNDTAMDYPTESTLSSEFSRQVEETPDAVALVFENKALTYQQVDAQSNQIARYLQEQGVKAGELVGICVNRSERMLVYLYACLLYTSPSPRDATLSRMPSSA